MNILELFEHYTPFSPANQRAHKEDTRTSREVRSTRDRDTQASQTVCHCSCKIHSRAYLPCKKGEEANNMMKFRQFADKLSPCRYVSALNPPLLLKTSRTSSYRTTLPVNPNFTMSPPYLQASLLVFLAYTFTRPAYHFISRGANGISRFSLKLAVAFCFLPINTNTNLALQLLDLR